MSEIKFADPKGLAHYSTPSELTPYMRETRKFVLRKIQYLIWTVLRPQSDFQVPASSLPDSYNPRTEYSSLLGYLVTDGYGTRIFLIFNALLLAFFLKNVIH